MTNTPVFIAGGGPVGMMVALELAHHGVHSILAERNPTTTRSPKMDLTNGRAMELLRRLGVADKMRAVGVPSDHLLDIVWATGGEGKVLYSFDYPSPDTKRAQDRELNDGAQTLEPGLRVSQVIIEPVLKAMIDASPLVDVRFGWAVTRFSQDAEGVDVTIKNDESGKEEKVRAAWLAACDGGGSTVREQADIKLEGQFSVVQAYMVHFRSKEPTLARFGRQHPAYHVQTDVGTLVAQDGSDTFTLHPVLPPGTDPKTVDPRLLLRQFFGRDIDCEIILHNPWTPHLVVAERYRAGRVLLVGDASHQFIPTGGYGMNTGVCDAVGAGWALAAVVNGWGGDKLLDGFAIERRQVALRNREAARFNMGVRIEIMPMIAAAVQEGGIDGPEGASRRAEMTQRIAALGNAENESWGIEHGYRYDDSPVICYEEGTPPPLHPLYSRPSTWPGSRLPMFFLRDGRALYDLLGTEFTLIVVGDTDPGQLPAAAAEVGLPLKVLNLADEPHCRLLERKLVLVRPDHHVAWRSDLAPASAQAIIAKVIGRA